MRLEKARLNLVAVTDAIDFLAHIKSQHLRYATEAREDLWRISQQRKNESRRKRFQIVFEARNKGLTFQDVGEIIGVGSAQAGNLYRIAKLWAKRGKLYSSKPLPLLTTEIT